MKKIFFVLLLISMPAAAHHTKEHTMLTQDTEQVIAETKQGADNSGSTFLWLGIAAVLGLGVIKLFKKK